MMDLEELTAVLLDEAVSPRDLIAAADKMYDIFCTLFPVEKDTDDTALPSGSALSPRLASMGVKDAMRTAVFLRGIEAAIRKKVKPVEILYAGTGPFAPLALPLMTRFKPDDIRFTLLDIHQRSIEGVRTLVDHFGFHDYVRDFVVADATEYKHGGPIDLLVVEAMQAALSKEPQVAIVRNLAPQLAEGGILIPQCVTVDVVLVDGAAETQRALGKAVPHEARLKLGTAVELTQDGGTFELSVRMPSIDRYTLAYFTRIEVFGKHKLDEYQSGLTYPQMQWNVRPKAGETLVFSYQTGPRPGVCHRVIPSREDGEESPTQVLSPFEGDPSPSSRLGMTPAVSWLRKRLPALDENDKSLIHRIDHAIRRATTKGYKDPAAIRLYVLLMFALGPHFDERERVREYFDGATGSLDDRLLKMPAWSHPNCWLRDESDEWPDAVRTGKSACPPLDWPDSDPVPAQLQSGYGVQIDVPHYATPQPVIATMLDLAELTPADFLLDLGSGDGRIAIAAALRFGVRAEGIDIDSDLVRKATEAAHDARVAHLVTFRRQDLLDTDFSHATVVTMYLLHDINLRIRARLREQLRAGSRIISRSFDMGDWAPDAVVQTALGPVYRWRIS